MILSEKEKLASSLGRMRGRKLIAYVNNPEGRLAERVGAKPLNKAVRQRSVFDQ